MMSLYPASDNTDNRQCNDERLPYEVPQLIDCGKVSELTLSNGNDFGADSSYS